MSSFRRGAAITLALSTIALIAPEAPCKPLMAFPSLSAAAPFATAPKLELIDPLERSFGFDRFAEPGVERRSHGTSFFEGRYGVRTWNLVPELTLGGGNNDALGAPLTLTRPMSMDPSATPLREDDDLRLSLDLLDLSVAKTARGCVRRSIQFVRFGGEGDAFSLVACDGSLLPEALDRLSVIARPAGIERPSMPLPEDPDPHAVESGEWVSHVRLLNPRLAWAVERVAEAFPHKVVYVISGYRPSDHGGMHARGRAIDLFVMNVSNERVYKFCRTLSDVGCGYYPNSKFVHIDVRKPGSGKAYWIDDSTPGTASHYVDSWPGVEKGGAAVWQGAIGEH